MFRNALWVLAAFLFSIPAFAGIDRPGREEIIDEVARATELSKNAVSLVFKESPDLLDSMDEAVFAVKVINKFSEAKDTEALADLQDYALGKALDKMRDKLLPQAMNGLLLAFGAYKTSLEIIRDYHYLPKFDNKIYQAYKEARQDDLRRGDTSFESKQTAFSRATTQKSSGYFVVKDQMYERMIKAKDYKKEHIGEKLEKELRGRIDNFWRDRLELRLQQELLQARRTEMIAAVWQNRGSQLDAIRAKAGRAVGPEGLFITQNDLPRNWKMVVREGTKPDEIVPHKRNDGAFAQIFKLKPTDVRERNNTFYDASGKNVLTFMHNVVRVAVLPAVQTTSTGYVMNFKEQIKESLRKGTSDAFYNAKILRPWTEAGVEMGYLTFQEGGDHRRADNYIAVFTKGGWYVTLEVSGYTYGDLEQLAREDAARSKSPVLRYLLKTPASEETLTHLARAIAGKIK